MVKKNQAGLTEIIPKRWIGRWLIAVAILHTVFGVFGFGVVVVADSLGGILSDGLINSVGADPGRWAIAWFLLFGFLLLLTGFFIDWVEAHSNNALPSWLGWGMLVIIIIGIVLFRYCPSFDLTGFGPPQTSVSRLRLAVANHFSSKSATNLCS